MNINANLVKTLLGLHVLVARIIWDIPKSDFDIWVGRVRALHIWNTTLLYCPYRYRCLAKIQMSVPYL